MSGIKDSFEPQSIGLRPGVTPARFPWIFSPTVDLLAFGGSAVVSLGLLVVGGWLGLLQQDTPSWAWVVTILLVDVAHVYATGFRVYFDRDEVMRRPWLYTLTPLLAFAFGWSIYSESVNTFWTSLAYLAVFHFVRQQYGWVALYRNKAGETGTVGRAIDTAAIYLATVYPLVYWHCHLPREFWWFRKDDFLHFSIDWSGWLFPFYVAALVAYAVKSVAQGVRYRCWNPGKDLVLATTALCWYLGIITFNSDYAFTVTNVIIHGVPYMVLVYWYQVHRSSSLSGASKKPKSIITVARFVGLIWLLAYVEELVWDRSLWNERGWLFGTSWDLQSLDFVLIPLLAVPQVTHYVLDGFIWRRRTSRDFARIAKPA